MPPFPRTVFVPAQARGSTPPSTRFGLSCYAFGVVKLPSAIVSPWFVSVLLLLLGWHGTLFYLLDEGLRRFDAQTSSLPALAEADSPKNLSSESASPAPWRNVRIFCDPDSYLWLSYARDWCASSSWRIRWTHADNAPFGRAVHWAQLPVWGLAFLSWCGERVAGLPPEEALSLAGRLLMPVTAMLFFPALFLCLRRLVGNPLAALSTLAMAIGSSFDFYPLRPDHHGFQIAFSFLCLVFLLGSGLGRFRAPVLASRASAASPLLPPFAVARRRFVLSGLFAGLALWLGATVFAFIMAITVLGLAVAFWGLLRLDTDSEAISCPRLFRIWGWTAAATSLLFYLLEYAPNHFSMRLEVNHPLYALWILGLGHLLAAFCEWRISGRFPAPRRWPLLLLAFLAAAALPALVLFGPLAWYVPRTPLMLRLHEFFILEFKPLWEINASFSWFSPRYPTLVFALLVIGAAVTALRTRLLPPAWRLPLLALTVSSVALLLLVCWQVRWEQFSPFFFVLLAVFLARALWAAARPALRAASAALAALVLVLGVWDAVADLYVPCLTFFHRRLDTATFRNIAVRNSLLTLKASPGFRPSAWLAPVDYAPYIHYFGLGSAVASLYWENFDGLDAQARLLSSPAPFDTAAAIARERRLERLCWLSDARLEADLFRRIADGSPAFAPGLELTFGAALSGISEHPLPPWLVPDIDLSTAAGAPVSVYNPRVDGWGRIALDTSIYSFVLPPEEGP